MKNEYHSRFLEVVVISIVQVYQRGYKYEELEELVFFHLIWFGRENMNIEYQIGLTGLPGTAQVF